MVPLPHFTVKERDRKPLFWGKERYFRDLTSPSSCEPHVEESESTSGPLRHWRFLGPVTDLSTDHYFTLKELKRQK